MVVVECAVVGALVIVAWSMVVNPPAQKLAPIAATPRADSGDGNQPLTPGVAQPKAARAQLPGLNVDPSFWRLRLAELNRGQAAFEALEWRLVRSAMTAAHRYVESVVLPSIARAERR
jgi:hypothetical protein